MWCHKPLHVLQFVRSWRNQWEKTHFQADILDPNLRYIHRSKNAVNLSLYLSYNLPCHMQNFYHHILSTKILYTFLIIHTYVWRSTHLTLLDLIVLIWLDKESHQVPQHKIFSNFTYFISLMYLTLQGIVVASV
jgi:hypothetical protein